MHTIKKLAKHELIRGLPMCKFEYDQLCDACAKGKQTRSSFKSKNNISTFRSLELLHMNLCGPISIPSLGHSKYILVIVDDYSRFTWVSFLKEKNEAFEQFSKICSQLQVYKNLSIVLLEVITVENLTKKNLSNFVIFMELLTIFLHQAHLNKMV